MSDSDSSAPAPAPARRSRRSLPTRKRLRVASDDEAPDKENTRQTAMEQFARIAELLSARKISQLEAETKNIQAKAAQSQALDATLDKQRMVIEEQSKYVEKLEGLLAKAAELGVVPRASNDVAHFNPAQFNQQIQHQFGQHVPVQHQFSNTGQASLQIQNTGAHQQQPFAPNHGFQSNSSGFQQFHPLQQSNFQQNGLVQQQPQLGFTQSLPNQFNAQSGVQQSSGIATGFVQPSGFLAQQQPLPQQLNAEAAMQQPNIQQQANTSLAQLKALNTDPGGSQQSMDVGGAVGSQGGWQKMGYPATYLEGRTASG